MLTEERQKEILNLLNQKGSVTLQDLKDYLDASESTIRRDLIQLAERGELVKVFGGAVKKEDALSTKEKKVSQRIDLNRDAKMQIGRYAASLICPNDFVYLDAGTTTGCMIPFISEKSASFVTNAVSHALQMVENGFRVILIGGELKASTQAIVGSEACSNMKKFHFTKAFLGANGLTPGTGYTTPDINEAIVKETALKHSRQAYILCDSSKFSQITPVSFGEFSDAEIITERYTDESLRQYSNIICV